MKFMTWHDLFGSITGVRNKKRTLANAQWQVLTEDTHFNGYEYAKGSRFKAWEGTDFGYVCFAGDTLTPDGNRPGRLIHRY